jgi:hypothetical protein
MDKNRTHAPGQNDTEEQLSTILHALRASRRRKVIHFLDDEKTDTTISTRSLARKIAGRENGIPPEHMSGEPYKNVYNALSHTHLPTLTKAGIIVYDPQRQHVEKGPSFHLAALLLKLNTPTVETFYRQFHRSGQS